MGLLFVRCFAVGTFAVAIVLSAKTSQAENRIDSSACSSPVDATVPQTSISNGLIRAFVYLPDAQKGYYRSSRFDWSGVVPCLTYKGHNYFGVWFSQHDPLISDSVMGPVEEFRSSDGALGYDQVKAGGLFVKPGIGVLRKVDDSPYRYMFAYPVVDAGKWSIRAKASEVTMRQRLQSQVGYSYDYEKTLRLDKEEPVLIIEHQLKNTGTKTIETDVYEHDFFMLDNAPTGPGMVIHFTFEPKANKQLEPGAKIVGKDIILQEELPAMPRRSITSFLTGFSNSASDYDFTLENTKTGVGVQQSGDSPMSNFNLWLIRTTVAPEAYVHLNIAPGKTAHWNIRYRFFAK